MYDPSVVDTFIRIHKSIAPKDRDPKLGAIGAIMASDYEVPSTTAPSPIANEVDTDESRIASELANLLENDTALSSVGDRLARHLRRLFQYRSTCTTHTIVTVMS